MAVSSQYMEDVRLVESQGFTLVELVTVIILIEVLSAFGVALFARQSSFSPLLATQQLESATLLAQQAALAGNPNRFLIIDQDESKDVFIFRVQGEDPDRDVLREFSLPRGGTTIAVNDNPIPLSTPIEFDGFGAPTPSVDRMIDIIGESHFRLCLNRLGALYRVSSGGSCP